MQPSLPQIRTATSDAVGTSGASLVKGRLQALRQGVNLATENDVGTDFHMELREPESGLGIGLTVGGQIESGEGWFRSPGVDPERGSGWWYYESTGEHFSFWSQSSIPYILILFNPTTDTAHWTSVTKNSIVPTGQGSKIFVPERNTISVKAIDAFIRMAVAHMLANPFQGSIWRTEELHPDPEQQYRLALIAPRLVAPHPNQGALTPVQPAAGIGTVLTGFVHYIDSQLARSRPEDPSTGPSEQPDWGWTLYHGLKYWMESGKMDLLEDALASASSPSEIAAATVASAAALVCQERHRAALERITSAERSSMSPIDRLWLDAHEIQLLYELGQEAEAQEMSTECAARIRGMDTDDPVSLSVLTAAVTSVVVSLEDWDTQDIRTLIQSRDNLAAWWRSFSLEPIISRHVDQDFDAIGRTSDSKRREPDPDSHNGLLAASITALFAADYASWRKYRRTLAKREVVLEGTTWAATIGSFDSIRMCGGEKEAGQLALAMWAVGPTADISRVIRTVPPIELTRTSFAPTVAALRCAGDLIPRDERRMLVGRLIEAIRGQGRLGQYCRSVDIKGKALGAIATMLAESEPEAQRSVLELLLRSNYSDLRSIDEACVSVIDNIDQAILEEFQVQVAEWLRASPGIDAVNTGARDFTVAMCGRLQETSSEARQFLTALVSHGHDCGVNHLQESFISDELARKFVDVWVAHNEERVRDCTQAGLGFGGSEPGEILALAFMKRPQLADWSLLYSFLEDRDVYAFMKRRVLELMVLDKAQIPDQVVGDLCRLLESGIPARDFVPGLRANETLAGMPAIAMARLRKTNWPSAVSSALLLASGGVRQRRDAVTIAEIAGRPGLRLLDALRNDQHVNVALAARSASMYWQLFHGNKLEFGEAFSRLASGDCSVGVELALARRIASMDHGPGIRRYESVRKALEASQSARVRRALVTS